MSRGGRAIAIPKQVPCRPPPLFSIEKKELDLRVWSASGHMSKIQAVRCLLRNRTICTNTGFFGSRGIVLDSTEQETVTPGTCRQAWDDKEYRSQPLKELQHGVWVTNNTLNLQYKWCCQDFCQSIVNFLIEVGTIATVDKKTTISDLGDTGGCPPNAGQCVNSGGTIIWNSTILVEQCSIERLGEHIDHLIRNHIIIEAIQGAFTILRPTNICHLTFAYETEQGPILQFSANLSEIQDSISLVTPEREAVVSDKDPQNAKIQYLYDKIMEQESKLFRTVWLELCHAAERHLKMIWQFLKLDPTLGARALLMRNDIVATFAGQALMIWECVKVTPDQFFWDYRINNTCYACLPILSRNITNFVVPGSRDLLDQAPIVDCNHHTIGLYHDPQEGWKTSSGPVHVTSVPFDVSWTGSFRLQTFNSPSYFHDTQTGILHTFGLMRSYFSKLRVLEGTLDRLIKYTANLALDPSVIYQTLAGTGKAIAEVTEGATKSLENIATTGTDNLISLTNCLVSGPLQLILNILIVLSILAGVAIVTWFILQRYLRRKACSCPSYFTRRKWFPRRPNEPAVKFSTLKQRLETKGNADQISSTKDIDPSHNAREILSVSRAKEIDYAEVELDSLSHVIVQALEPIVNTPKKHKMKTELPTVANNISGLCQDRWPTIEVWINEDFEVPVTTLIDSGSDISLMGLDLATRRGYNLLPAAIPGFRVFNNVTTEVVASCWIKVSLNIANSVVASAEFLRVHVVKDSTYDLLLGTDYLRRFARTDLQWKKAQIDFGNISVPMKNTKIYLPETSRGIAVLDETITLAPRSISFVTARLEAPYAKFDSLIFEPISRFLNRFQLQVASCLVRPDDGIIPVSVLNTTNTPIILYRNTKVGKVRVYRQPWSCGETSLKPQCQVISSTVGQQGSYETGNIGTVSEKVLDVINEEIKQAKLSPKQGQQFRQLLARFSLLFARDESDLGKTNLAEHTIDTGDNRPIRQIPYRVPYKQREAIDEEINKMLEKGVITPSQSPWASPVVLVPKKTGGSRFCVDCRKLNSVTKKDIRVIKLSVVTAFKTCVAAFASSKPAPTQ